MEVQDESVIKKPKRLTSVVWNHFERVPKGEICYAVCVHCNKKLSGSSNSGTTHLRNHLIRCLKRSNFDVSQLLAVKKRKKDVAALSLPNVNFVDGQRNDEYLNVKPTAFVKFDQDTKKEEIVNLGSSKFDQERSQLDLTRMIISHGYPISMVSHVGFKVFVKNLQPLFEVTPDSEVEVSCLEIYAKEKQKVYEMVKNLRGRINVAVETWCSSENAEFLCLTAYYIDEDWKLQKKILNFITLEPSHTQDKLSEVIVKYLIDWDIDSKLFALTFDDCFTNDDIVLRVKDQIAQNRNRLSSGEIYDIRSAAHVLNLIVRDAMEALREVTQKIRESIIFVKSSEPTQAKFNEIAQQVGINSQRILALDCPTRWNSTLSMLESALEYRGAFSIFQENDPTNKSALTETEWDWASSVSGYLRLFADVTNNFSSSKFPADVVYFPEICDVHLLLIEQCKSADHFICSMAIKMKAKFDKYWSKCSLVLAVKAILDPRFKMKLVEYYFSQIYGSTALDRIKEISDGVRELFNAYTVCVASSPGSSLPSTSYDIQDRLKGFDKFLHETSRGQGVVSDLDKYLEEPIFPRNGDFNVLNWWKVHTPRYPVLSMMARDVLGTPFSTVTPESAFSTGGRVIDHARSLLSPETRQALICSQDWLRTEQGEFNHSALSLFMERHER